MESKPTPFRAPKRISKPVRWPQVVAVRFGPADSAEGFDVVCRAARAVGVSPASFVRQVALTAARRVESDRRRAS